MVLAITTSSASVRALQHTVPIFAPECHSIASEMAPLLSILNRSGDKPTPCIVPCSILYGIILKGTFLITGTDVLIYIIKKVAEVRKLEMLTIHYNSNTFVSSATVRPNTAEHSIDCLH